MKARAARPAAPKPTISRLAAPTNGLTGLLVCMAGAAYVLDGTFWAAGVTDAREVVMELRMELDDMLMLMLMLLLARMLVVLDRMEEVLEDAHAPQL